MDALAKEIAAYDVLQPELEATHLGRWAVVKDATLVGTFADFRAAAMEAVKRFGRGPFLIRQIGAPPMTLPASVLFGL